MSGSDGNKEILRIRGRGTAIQVSLAGPGVPSIPEILCELRTAGSLIKDLQVTFDLGNVKVTREWLSRLIFDVIYPLNISVRGWIAKDSESENALSSLGFVSNEVRPVMAASSLKILWNPLRSGQSFHQEGDLIMVGDLHDGSEITATGSICVLGKLKGLVHAGSAGDNNATVIALSYMTNQLRIGTMVSNTVDPNKCSWWGKNVAITVQNGTLVVREILKGDQ